MPACKISETGDGPAPATNSAQHPQQNMREEASKLVEEVHRMVTTINRRFAREWLQQRSPFPQKKRVATNLLTQARAWASMVWLRGKLPGDITEVRAIQNSIAEVCGAFAKVRVLLGGNDKGCLAADYVYFHVTARMQGGRQTATGCRPWDTWLHDRSLLFMSEQQTTNTGDWETSPQLGTPAHNPDEPHPIPLLQRMEQEAPANRVFNMERSYGCKRSYGYLHV